MRIHTSLTPTVRISDPSIDCAVVIDVLRATTVMTSALFHGANEVVTCGAISEAKRLRSESASKVLLCGERGCQPIEGFDLGNSPSDYTRSRVGQHQIILTTTNGTRAIEWVADRREVFIASFLNIRCVTDSLCYRNSVALVCSGTENQVSGEDVLLAGAMIDRWSSHWGSRRMQLCDASMLALQHWRSLFDQRPNKDELAMGFRKTLGGRNLIRVGYEKDLAICAKIDEMPVLIQRVSRTPMRFTVASE